MRAIYGAGEQGRVVLDILRAGGDTDDLVFVDDDESCHGELVSNVPVIGDLNALISDASSARCLVAFGACRGVRLELVEAVADAGLEFFEAVHPEATISEQARLGDGITVNAQSYIGPGVVVGNHSLVDSCVNISHDVQLAEGVTVTPNATLAGRVTVGHDAYIGAGAVVLDGVSIGKRAVVGAGAVVTSSVPDDVTVVGVPAEPLNE